jgi:hypothetical protein
VGWRGRCCNYGGGGVGLIGWEVGGAMSFMKLMISICFTLSCMLIVYGAYQLT